MQRSAIITISKNQPIVKLVKPAISLNSQINPAIANGSNAITTITNAIVPRILIIVSILSFCFLIQI